MASTVIPELAPTATATASAAIFPLRMYNIVVEHRVRPIRHIVSMEVFEKHAFLEAATATAVGLPPGLRRRPRVTVARVESRDRREISVGEGPGHQSKVVRDGPDKKAEGM